MRPVAGKEHAHAILHRPGQDGARRRIGVHAREGRGAQEIIEFVGFPETSVTSSDDARRDLPATPPGNQCLQDHGPEFQESYPYFHEKDHGPLRPVLDPPDDAVVLSVDETTRVQALDRTQPTLPMRPGQIERRTHDYKRHGTASLYAAFDIASGEVMGRITTRHRAKEFLAFLRQIEHNVAPQLDIHIILDNSSTHSTEQIKKWLNRRPRFHLHFTPTSASWLNAVETWFSQLTRRAIQRNTFTSVEALRREIRRYIQVHNQDLAKPFRWTKSAACILQKVEQIKRSQYY